MQVREQQLELDMEQDWLQIGNRSTSRLYIVTLLMLTYMQSTPWEMLCLKKLSYLKITGRNINNLRYADEPPLWQKVKRN